MEDKTWKQIGGLADVRCDGNLRQALFHRELTRGFEDPQQCRDTTLRWLQDMLHDNRTHRELGRDVISLAKLVPLPFDEALRTLASRHGWPAEALMQAVVSITNWLEHHETVLREKADGPLSCTPPIPIFGGGPPSSRKTSLAGFASEVLLRVRGAPPRWVYLQERDGERDPQLHRVTSPHGLRHC